MTVLDILIVSLGFGSDGREVVGDVQFMIDHPGGGTRTLTMRCQCQTSRRVRPDALLIGNAIHQLRRMPEIRSGQARLHFAKGLKPLLTADAA